MNSKANGRWLRSFKRFLNRGVHATGLHIGRFPPPNTLAAKLAQLFTALQVNCVIDVGGHHGEFALELRETGYRGRIVSFEPIRATHAILAEKARADDDWQARHLALGSEDGDKEMNIYAGTVFNSFLSSSDFGAERFGKAVERQGSERVQVRRLDGIFADCVAGIAAPRVFLKMDTQGWDLEVLEGARGVLDSVVGIQSELAVKNCYDGMTRYTRALEKYESFGFELTGIFPVAFEPDGLRLVEVDCVFIAAPGRPEELPDQAARV